jgi:replicative DNA helicase
MNLAQALPAPASAERMVIASVLADPRKYFDVAPMVRREDFSCAELREAWDCISGMASRNERISLWSIQQRHGQHPWFESFRDAICLTEGNVPAYAVDYAAVMADKARLRRATIGLTDAATMASNAESFEGIRPSIENLMMGLCETTERSDVATTAAIVQGIREARKSPAKQRSQFPTGFDRLDGMLGGGPRESHLVIVAAATSGGKTSLALNMGLNMAGQGIPAAMLSLEMARDELTMRGAAALSDGEDPDSGLNAIERLPFVISDNPDLSAEGARTMVKMLSARYGTKVVILDYLQLLRESGSRTSNREREVAGMSRSLKLAAKETGVCIIALSQVNEHGQLRESRALEQDADAVVYIIAQKGRFYLRITKNRHGPRHGHIADITTNEVPGIPLHFDGPSFRFCEQ